MARETIIVGNWKMHLPAGEARKFIEAFLPLVKSPKCAVFIAPPYTSIEAAKVAAKGSFIQIGAQNMSEYPEGPYTGEISSEMLKEAGASFAIIGHSERRHIFHEDDRMARRKIKQALADDILPILCIGETEEERGQDKTKEVLERQLGEGLKEFSNEQIAKVMIAYEPVWAIGTGKTATPAMAQETHHLCRQFIQKRWNSKAAERIPILYGGSVKPDNIASLIMQPDIDGALVGGASIQADAFAQIIKNVEETLK